jgi:hypothetical protein
MGTEAEPNSTDEKSHFLNRHDMDFRLICLSISPELLFHVESFSTPDEVWTKLEVLFRKKDDHEECMPENAKTKPTENPLEEQASQLPPEANFRVEESPLHASQEQHASSS